MSWERLAEALGVDAVEISHGEKGYLFTVRKSNSWLATTVDHSELEDTHHRRRAVLMADRLNTLSDRIHKALGVERATRDKVREAERSVMDRYPAMRDVWGDNVHEAAHQPTLRDTYVPPPRREETYGRVVRSDVQFEYDPPRGAIAPEREPEPEPETPQMSSRFEAIVRELEGL